MQLKSSLNLHYKCLQQNNTSFDHGRVFSQIQVQDKYIQIIEQKSQHSQYIQIIEQKLQHSQHYIESAVVWDQNLIQLQFSILFKNILRHCLANSSEVLFLPLKNQKCLEFGSHNQEKQFLSIWLLQTSIMLFLSLILIADNK